MALPLYISSLLWLSLLLIVRRNTYSMQLKYQAKSLPIYKRFEAWRDRDMAGNALEGTTCLCGASCLQFSGYDAASRKALDRRFDTVCSALQGVVLKTAPQPHVGVPSDWSFLDGGVLCTLGPTRIALHCQHLHTHSTFGGGIVDKVRLV